ncbi:uncharacterized protein [Henckelia pumila]|uniref:uncharacterized protein n=1 Tax=Henckelia pumila TaxID=405737 RepID=UPI003C6E2C00
MKIRHKAKQGIDWRIGGGLISFWFDSWFSESSLSSLIPIQGQPSRLVDWFLDDRKWNIARLLLLVPLDFSHRIMDVPIHPVSKDVVVWKPVLNHRFSIKFSWELVWHRHTEFDWLKGCWSKLFKPSLSILCWRWFFKRIHADEIMEARGIALASVCQGFCNQEPFAHLFFERFHAVGVWHNFSRLF